MCNAKIGDDFDWQPITDLQTKFTMSENRTNLEIRFNETRIMNLQDDIQDMHNELADMKNQLGKNKEELIKLKNQITALQYKITELHLEDELAS